MSIMGFEKLPTTPGNLEGQVHAQGYEHAQEIAEEAIIHHLSLALRIYTRRKWRLSQSFKLPVLKACTNTYKFPWQVKELLFLQWI